MNSGSEAWEEQKIISAKCSANHGMQACRQRTDRFDTPCAASTSFRPDVYRGSVQLVFGGVGDSGQMNDVWIFNTDQRGWTHAVVGGDKPCPREMHSGTMVDSTTMLIYGGRAAGGKCGPTIPHPFCSQQLVLFSVLFWPSWSLSSLSPAAAPTCFPSSSLPGPVPISRFPAGCLRS